MSSLVSALTVEGGNTPSPRVGVGTGLGGDPILLAGACWSEGAAKAIVLAAAGACWSEGTTEATVLAGACGKAFVEGGCKAVAVSMGGDCREPVVGVAGGDCMALAVGVAGYDCTGLAVGVAGGDCAGLAAVVAGADCTGLAAVVAGLGGSRATPKKA